MTIPEPQFRHRIARGVAGNFLTLVFNQGSYFLLGILVAQFLGKAAYGQFYILQVTVLAASILGQSFCGTPLTRYLANLRSSAPDRCGQLLRGFMGIAFLLALVLGVGLIAGAKSFSQHILGQPGVSTALLPIALVVFAYVISEACQGALAGLEGFQHSGVIAVIIGLLLWSSSFLLLRNGTLDDMLWAWAIIALLRLGALFGVTLLLTHRHMIPLRRPQRGNIGREVWQFAVPCSLIGLTSAIAPWLMATFLLQSKGDAQAATYGAAVTLRQMILMFPAILNGVILSLLNHRKSESIASARQLFHWTLLVVFLSSTFTALLVWLFGPRILQIFGKSFRDGELVLQLLTLSAIPIVLTNTYNQIMLSQEKIWLLFFTIALPRDISLAALSWWVCVEWGVTGLATLNLIVCILVLTGIFLLTRYIRLNNNMPECACNS